MQQKKGYDHHDLIAHLSRVEGQLKAVREALERDDCSKAAKTLLAATRSLSSARSECISQFLSERVYKCAPLGDKKLMDDVRALMKA